MVALMMLLLAGLKSGPANSDGSDRLTGESLYEQGRLMERERSGC